MPRLFPTVLLWLITAGAAVAAPASPPSPPEAFTAVYDVEARGLAVGVARRSLERCGEDCYRFRSEAHPQGLLRLFRRGPLIEESRWRQTERVRPQRYLYLDRTGSEEKRITVDFDWDAGHVQARGDREWQAPLPPGAQDPLSYQIALMRDLAAGATEVTYPVAERRRLTRYRFVREAEETLDTPLGKLETVRLRRVRENRRRETRIWCAPALGFLPLRMEQEERDGTVIRLRIRSVEGLTAASNRP